MPDTEKAISLLQQCLDERPYAAVRVSQIMSCIQETVELLKEQEPVKPIVAQYAFPVQFIKKYYCGICKEEITRNNVYCHKCGRKVKWDD